MGAGAGKNPAVGMPISPMVELAEKRSKKTGQVSVACLLIMFLC